MKRKIYPLKKRVKIRRSILGELQNVFANAERFQWSHAFLLQCLSEGVYGGERWDRLSLSDHEYVRGAAEILHTQHWRKVEFSYEFPSVGRLRLSDPEYRKIPPQEVSQFWLHTGAYVYRDAPHKLFTEPKGEGGDNVLG